jgi:hypothetical protein
MDSKIQFRDASPPPSAWAPSFDGEWWLLEPSQQLDWFAEADDCSDDTATPTVDRPQLGRSAEASKPLLISRGTGSSNPFPSSSESATNQSRGIHPREHAVVLGGHER